MRVVVARDGGETNRLCVQRALKAGGQDVGRSKLNIG
jgi:hypothetical protein